MSKNLKIFLIVFLISIPFWWEINVFQKNLEEFLFWQEMAENPEILAAQTNQKIIEEKLRKLKPIRNSQVEDLQIEAKSAISVLTRPGLADKVLFEKESDKKLPIASLTKLMTTNIVLENYDLSQVVKISKKAVEEQGESGELKIGEIFRVKDLLYPLLMESSNDAAYALSEIIGEKNFIDLINIESANLGLKNTYFINTSGLDPENPTDPKNYSTAEDLIKITEYLLKEDLIWDILSSLEFDLYSSDGVFHHRLKNTNELLQSEDFKQKIIGGKTGWTPQAQGCLILVLEAPKENGYLINVILGSENRFEEMKKLVNWTQESYRW